MRRTAMITAGLLLGAGLLAGCGGGDDKDGKASGGGDYCDTLKSAASNIKSFTADDATPDFSKFEDFIDTAHDLSDEAPSAVKDDWKVMVGAMDDLTAALEDAGLSIEDFGKLASGGTLPEGFDQSKLTELSSKLQSLASADVEKAGDAIDKHAKDECGIDLSTS